MRKTDIDGVFVKVRFERDDNDSFQKNIVVPVVNRGVAPPFHL